MPGIIERKFWRDPDLLQTSSDARLLACYLLTGPHHEMIGAYYLPAGYAAADLRWDLDRLHEAQKALTNLEFALRCDATGYVILPRWFDYHPIGNPNQGHARLRLLDAIPRCFKYWGLLLEAFGKDSTHLPDGWLDRFNRFDNPSESITQTVLQGFDKASAIIERERERDRERDRENDTAPSKTSKAPGSPSPGFLAAWEIYPKRAGGNSRVGAWKAWNARINEGKSEEEMFFGTMRYHAYCEALDQINTPYVMQGSRFYGPRLEFADPWDQGNGLTKSKLKTSIDKIRDYVTDHDLQEVFHE